MERCLENFFEKVGRVVGTHPVSWVDCWLGLVDGEGRLFVGGGGGGATGNFGETHGDVYRVFFVERKHFGEDI